MIRLNIQMFASGTIAKTSSPSAGDIRILWSSTLNPANNTSNVTATVQVRRLSSGLTYGSFSGTVTINGNTKSINKYRGADDGWTTTWKDVGSHTVNNIAHGSDGKKSINIQSTLTQNKTSLAGTYKTGTSGSANATLDNNLRSSVLGTIARFEIGATVSIPITKHVAGYTDKLVISHGATVIKTINAITNGYSLTFSSGEKAVIEGLMKSPRITLVFTLSTWDGETQIGTNNVKNVVVTSLNIQVPSINIKKVANNYKVAINGLVNDSNNNPLQPYNNDGSAINLAVVPQGLNFVRAVQNLKIVCGSTTINSSSGVNISYSGFTSNPYIIATYSKTGALVSGDLGAIKIYNKTTTGATIMIGGTTSGNLNIDWVAIGIG